MKDSNTNERIETLTKAIKDCKKLMADNPSIYKGEGNTFLEKDLKNFKYELSSITGIRFK